MPARITRRAMLVIDEHANTIIFLMFAVMLVTAIFAAIGWNKARGAERRVTVIEAERAAEAVGKNIADVTTCFNAARNRPRLILILRGIAVELEPDPRAAIQDFIDEYGSDTPTIASCSKLATDRGIDPRPYVQNPPSSAGTTTQEGR